MRRSSRQTRRNKQRRRGQSTSSSSCTKTSGISPSAERRGERNRMSAARSRLAKQQRKERLDLLKEGLRSLVQTLFEMAKSSGKSLVFEAMLKDEDSRFPSAQAMVDASARSKPVTRRGSRNGSDEELRLAAAGGCKKAARILRNRESARKHRQRQQLSTAGCERAMAVFVAQARAGARLLEVEVDDALISRAELALAGGFVGDINPLCRKRLRDPCDAASTAVNPAEIDGV